MKTLKKGLKNSENNINQHIIVLRLCSSVQKTVLINYRQFLHWPSR